MTTGLFTRISWQMTYEKHMKQMTASLCTVLQSEKSFLNNVDQIKGTAGLKWRAVCV